MSVPVRFITPLGLTLSLGVAGCCFGGGTSTTGTPTDPGSLLGGLTGALGGAAAATGAPTSQAGSLGVGDRQLQSGEYQDTYSFNFPPGSSVLIRAESPDLDTYLIVHPPGGAPQIDNDDYEGSLSAGVLIPSAVAGEYQVIVTTYAPGQTGNYTLTTTPQGGAAAAVPVAPAAGAQTFNVAPGFTPDPMTSAPVVTAGDVQGSQMPGVQGFCSGSYPASPQVTVNVAGAMPNLRIVARSDRDIAMAVRFPDGHVECDDDGAGYPNPAINVTNAQPGAYQIHVGSWGSSGLGATAVVAVSENPNLATSAF